MPKLLRRKVKGRAQFDFNAFDKAKNSLWDRISEKPEKVPGDPSTDPFSRRIDALAMHVAGMPIADAARAVFITPAELYNFKSRWLARDSSLGPILANLLEASAVKATVVFNRKADEMNASEAATAAATLSKAAVNLRTGQNTNYTPPENVALETLDRIGRVLEIANQRPELKQIKPAKARVIEDVG